MSEPIVVFVSCADADQAERIAERLVRDRLAACCQILPKVRSVYVWKDEVCREDESVLTAKSDRDCFERLRQAVRDEHSYETPEIIALPISAGDEAYLDWIGQTLSERLP